MQVKLIFPEEYGSNTKVSVIKAIRILTGAGLKEAKELMEIPGQYIMDLPELDTISSCKSEVEAQLYILIQNGVKVSYYGILLDSLRKAAADAVLLGEDDIANNILQHVLALKLKYGL